MSDEPPEVKEEDPRAIAARQNGLLGGRPTNIEQIKLKKIRERARKRAAQALDRVVARWVSVVDDYSAPFAEWNRAGENLHNRFGYPPITGNVNLGDEGVLKPKMVVHRTYAAPASYSETPPEHVARAVAKFAAEQRERAVAAGLEGGQGERTDQNADE